MGHISRDSTEIEAREKAVKKEKDPIRQARELRLAPAKAPRTAAWFGEWEEAVAYLHRYLEEL